jgi:hypothetical protein
VELREDRRGAERHRLTTDRMSGLTGTDHREFRGSTTTLSSRR